MRRLLGIEFRRVFARDVTRLLGLIAIIGAVLGGIGAFVSTDAPPKSQAAEFDQTILRQRADLADRIKTCTTKGSPPAGLETDLKPGQITREAFPQLFEPRTRPECRTMLSGLPFSEEDRRFHLLRFPRIVEGLIFPSAIFALIIGATIIGAEWGAGTIPTLLTWEPRRVRVLFAKVLAVLAACASVFLLFALLVAATTLPALTFRGTAVGLDAVWQEDLMSVVLRGMYLSAISGLFGFSLALLIRNTAAALGAAFGYLLILENLVRATGALSAWLVSNNAAIVLAGFSPFRSLTNEEPLSKALTERSSFEAGMILGAYMLVAVLISGFLFHRRDVH